MALGQAEVTLFKREKASGQCKAAEARYAQVWEQQQQQYYAQGCEPAAAAQKEFTAAAAKDDTAAVQVAVAAENCTAALAGARYITIF